MSQPRKTIKGEALPGQVGAGVPSPSAERGALLNPVDFRGEQVVQVGRSVWSYRDPAALADAFCRYLVENLAGH